MNAIFFDAHGVLYHRQRPHAHLHAFLNQHAPQESLSMDVRAATATFKAQAMIGSVPREALYDAILAAYGVTDAAALANGRTVLAADDADITLFAGVPETLNELRRRGYKLGVVTDSVSPTAEKLRWFRSQGLHLTWDAFANSCEVGVRKPHPRIYHAALTQCGVAPSEALFVGHKASELEGARAVGMTTAAIFRDANAVAEYYLDTITDLLELPVS